MVKRNSKKSSYKKIFLIAFGTVIFSGSLFLFIVGLISIASLFPGVNTTESADVIAPSIETTSVGRLEKILYEKNITFTELYESSKSAVIIGKIENGSEIYFSKTKDALYQANSLQLILSKLTIDNKKPQVIDLRLERPIVKY